MRVRVRLIEGASVAGTHRWVLVVKLGEGRRRHRLHGCRPLLIREALA